MLISFHALMLRTCLDAVTAQLSRARLLSGIEHAICPVFCLYSTRPGQDPCAISVLSRISYASKFLRQGSSPPI
jgi:hypothetical protein